MRPLIVAVIAATALFAADPPAAAQPAATAAQPAETLLRLAESAEVTRAPDELRAALRAEARATTAAAAQEAVNRQVAAALARARAVPSVRATTGGYWTHRTSEPRGWQASQVIELRGGEPAPLLELAGTLQEGGLALSGLAWTLTREAERAAREEATRLAIEGLRRRADAVAGQLGMAVAGMRELRLDAPRPGPRPMITAALARGRAEAAAAAPPPAAVPEDAVVSATAEAEVVLRPR